MSPLRERLKRSLPPTRLKTCSKWNFRKDSVEWVCPKKIANFLRKLRMEFAMVKMRIPRLELAAATVSVRVTDMLKADLDYEDVEEFYWTDSDSWFHKQRIQQISCLRG